MQFVDQTFILNTSNFPGMAGSNNNYDGDADFLLMGKDEGIIENNKIQIISYRILPQNTKLML